MKKSNLLLLSFFIVSFLFIGCNKYEEGPIISLRSKTSRLCGTWKVTKRQLNGAEVGLSAEELSARVEYKSNQTFTVTSPTWPTSNGTWRFSSDKTKLIIQIDGQTAETESTIVRLTNSELVLEQAIGSDVFRSEYSKD